jgi:hypothetical protein
MHTSPFIVYGLPRSRTFWLSRFLTRDGWSCSHDEAVHIRSLDDVKAWLSLPMTGTVETAAAPFWRLIHDIRPDLKTVVVRRPVGDVIESMTRAGLSFDDALMRAHLRKLDAKLDQITARVPGTISVTFGDLRDEAACAQVYEHCHGAPLDPAWFASVAPLNLQVNLAATKRYYHAHADQLLRVARQAEQRMRFKLARSPIASTEFVFAQEPLDVVLRDGAGLISDHLVLVGEPPNNMQNKNLPLMKVIEDLGMLHVTTARQNGRMFGYLMTICAPSLEKAGRWEGMHVSAYASPDAAGLGLKLQRASIEHLRSLNVDAALFRAGVRGDGPRMGALYRRLGAEDFGQLYRLELKGAA